MRPRHFTSFSVRVSLAKPAGFTALAWRAVPRLLQLSRVVPIVLGSLYSPHELLS